jgi:hypothetical protein
VVRRRLVTGLPEAPAKTATGLGSVLRVLNTAGLSPEHARPEVGSCASTCTAPRCFSNSSAASFAPAVRDWRSSMAGYMLPALEPEQDRLLAQTSVGELL